MSLFTVVFSRTILAGAALPDGDAGLAAPPLDVVETREGLVVEVDVPGARPTEIRVTCHQDALVIEGVKPESVRSSACQASVERFHVVERAAGSFRRVIPLPWPVRGGGGEARVRDGVLTVSLPRGSV